MEEIKSRDNAKIKRAFKEKDAKGEYFLAEGFHLVEMALAAKEAIEIYSLKEYSAPVPVYIVNEEIIAKLSSLVHSEGIVALCRKKEPSEISSPRVLFLDGISDPGNLGTLLRTALSFSFTDVVISKGSANPYANKALMASQGAIFSLNLLFEKEGTVASLKNKGYAILSSDLKGGDLSGDINKDEKLCLVLGNEARGVSDRLLAAADARVKIPMSGIDSLNVGVAGGILMYLYRR